MTSLRKISQKKLNKIIKKHKHYLNKDCIGWEKMRADLSDTDLNMLNLSCADLRYANLYCSDLSYANLSDANLHGADLRYANLHGANLHGANLKYAGLSYTDLKNANLYSADLRNAILRYADLRNANLKYADLSYTDLKNADFMDANLIGSKLIGVECNYSTAFFASQCPEKGSFVGYKKSGGKIVELRIEEDSKRSSATSRKCRASKVTVLNITSIDGKEEFKKSENTGQYAFTYKVGETYEIEDFDDDRWDECSTGIHFFLTREEAVNY